MEGETLPDRLWPEAEKGSTLAGNASVLQATPSPINTPPPEQGFYQIPGSFASSSVPPQLPFMETQTPPPRHTTETPSSYDPYATVSSYDPHILPSPIWSSKSREHDHDTLSSQIQRQTVSTSYLRSSTTFKWIILVVTVIFVIVVSGIGVFAALPPTLSLSGSNTVAPGEELHLHGSGFIPEISLTLTLDNGLPLTFVDHSATITGKTEYTVETETVIPLQMIDARQAQRLAASDSLLNASSTGTFDVIIIVRENWSPGLHTIHATQGFKNGAVNFTVVPNSAKLVIQSSTLDFGQLSAGKQATQTITISNRGTQQLHWQADTGHTSWLTLDTATGTIQPGSLPQTIKVTADTSNLTVGIHLAEVHITSTAGNALIRITLTVTSPGPVVRTPTSTSQPTPTQQPTVPPTPVSTPLPSPTPTQQPTVPPTPVPTPTPTPQPSVPPTPLPSPTPGPSPSPSMAQPISPSSAEPSPLSSPAQPTSPALPKQRLDFSLREQTWKFDNS